MARLLVRPQDRQIARRWLECTGSPRHKPIGQRRYGVDVAEPSNTASGIGPLDAAHYRSVLGHFASGVTIVTAMTSSGPVGFTCQSFSSLSLDPPLIWIAPATSSSTWPLIDRVGAFTVNVLGADQETLAREFARSGADKFAGIGYDLGVTGAPRIHGTLAQIDCTVWSVAEAGDHYSVVGAVAGLASAHGLPLLFFRGGFGEFSQ